MKKENLICKRCNKGILIKLVESNENINFFECPICNIHWAKRSSEMLHDRWLSPISLVLYSQIFSKEPQLESIKSAQNFIKEYKNDKNFLRKVIREIDRELSNPIQNISEILNFSYPNEEKLRKYLKNFSIYLKEQGY